MKKIILRNDPAKKRKKLGKVKDLFETAIDDAQMFEFDIASGKIKKIKGIKWIIIKYSGIGIINPYLKIIPI